MERSGVNLRFRMGKKVVTRDRNIQVLSSHTVIIQAASEKEEHWLCQAELVHKRIDVRIGQIGAGKRSQVRTRAEGKTGYIELENTLDQEDLSTALTVHMDDASPRISIPAHSLQPERKVPINGELVNIWSVQGRVVIIGPDEEGFATDIGEYAWVEPQRSNEVVVTVRFAREGAGIVRTQVFPPTSLCRSTNSDGKRTKSTRFC
uniref:Uncharacterized protein n=1 Tax=Mycena chlorophos TaxID=658473 RepID=A0ABQ0M0G9_MYCCL|nr:predicted protein [Mycena chlorophos]